MLKVSMYLQGGMEPVGGKDMQSMASAPCSQNSLHPSSVLPVYVELASQAGIKGEHPVLSEQRKQQDSGCSGKSTYKPGFDTPVPVPGLKMREQERFSKASVTQEQKLFEFGAWWSARHSF